jgi:hypothetical protein
MAYLHATPTVQLPATRDAVADESPRKVLVAADTEVKAAIARVARAHVELLTELAKR